MIGLMLIINLVEPWEKPQVGKKNPKAIVFLRDEKRNKYSGDYTTEVNSRDIAGSHCGMFCLVYFLKYS